MVHVFGIRHHGPGSAKRLLAALQSLQPDCLLIEVPADAEPALASVPLSEIVPPVALLLYDAANLSKASWLPFASFSPEWQALLYAQEQSVPITFMDLPMTVQFALKANDDAPLLANLTSKTDPKLLRDPLGYMANLAGYTDGERWWDATFEQATETDTVFEAITEMMSALREGGHVLESTETLLREAFMRQSLRAALKKGFQRIAVVCGAWHAPVLRDWKQFDAKKDAALLRGLEKVKTRHTWIPWTYERLATQSGYAAGIISPAWYERLFHSPSGQVLGHWMAQVSRLLRDEGLEASAAQATEAVRLAESLASMRDKALPALEELEEAVLAVFCAGSTLPLELIRQRLIIGEKAGTVPDKLPSSPLQRDLENRLKAARLQKFWGMSGEQWLKASAAKPQGGIDLREATDLLKSQLLHQIKLLDIPWGTTVEVPDGRLGSFWETWKLHWQPEFLIRLIEAAMWGNTIFEAAESRTCHRAMEMENLPALSELTLETLKAGLSDAASALIERLGDLATLDKDIFHLLDCLPTLINIARYGDVRKTDAAAVNALIGVFIPHICIALPGACTGVDEAVPQDIFQKILSLQRAIHLPEKADYIELWQHALLKTALHPAAHPLLRGACTRMLFEEKFQTPQQTAQHMQLALSRGQTTLSAAQWVEGFLHGSGLLLIHQPALWSMLDEWLVDLDEAAFKETLPVLRRTFSNFSTSERRKMLAMAASENLSQSSLLTDSEPDTPQKALAASDAVRLLLGLPA